MKRFWTHVSVEPERAGFGITLDARPLRTPARALLAVPTRPLADAIADEWRRIEDNVEPRAMPLTGLANAAVDRVVPDRQAFATALARYAEADLTCYRAQGPEALAKLQAESWDMLLGWARRRFDVDFTTTCGLVHEPQPPATVERLAHAVAALDPFSLAGLSPLVTIGGSLVGALAVAEQAMSAEQVWWAVTVDDRWHADQWGSDAEVEVVLEHRRRDFFAAARFIALLG